MVAATKVRVGIAGFGNVGRKVAAALASGAVEGVDLTAVTAGDLDKARANADLLPAPVAVVPLRDLPNRCDLVLECATSAAFAEVAHTVVDAGKDLICVSAGGFLQTPDLVERAKARGCCVQIASGAMPGLDILRSAAEGTLRSVHLYGRLKPESMASEPYVVDQGHDFSSSRPTEPVRIFKGTAGEAARQFPRHMNVAVAISLAGLGFERTTIELWVDPDIPGAIHQLDIRGDEISLTLVSRNYPSDNPKTSRIVAPSVLAAVRERVSTLRIGS